MALGHVSLNDPHVDSHNQERDAIDALIATVDDGRLSPAELDPLLVIPCESTAKPGGVEGRVIYEIDTDHLLAYSGGSWKQIWPREDTGWINITPVSGYVGTLVYRVYAGVVYIRSVGNFTVPQSTATDITTQLPVGVRPSSTIRSGAYFSTHAGVVIVNTDGTIKGVQDYSTTTGSIGFAVSYPLG